MQEVNCPEKNQVRGKDWFKQVEHICKSQIGREEVKVTITHKEIITSSEIYENV